MNIYHGFMECLKLHSKKYVIYVIVLVESKTRTHHGRVGSGDARRGGCAGRARQGGTPTDLFAQEITVPRALQGIEDKCHEHLLGSTDKENPM